MINRERALELLRRLRALAFFPPGEEPMDALVDLVESMASSDDQVKWLVRKMTNGTYTQWPGLAEVRECFTSKFRPADGIEGHGSVVYPDGVPTDAEQAEAETKKLPERKKKLPELPPGLVTADPQLQAAVVELADEKDLVYPKLPRRLPQVLKPQKPPPLPPGVKPITAEDVEREARRLRDERARQELGLNEQKQDEQKGT